MNINNWLCKYFDEERKGYVTISDVHSVVVNILFVLFIVFLVLFGVGHIMTILFEHDIPYDITALYLILKYDLYLIIALLAVVALYLISVRIGKIKIAKCPLKKKEEE